MLRSDRCLASLKRPIRDRRAEIRPDSLRKRREHRAAQRFAHDSPLEGGGCELSVLVKQAGRLPLGPWVLSLESFGSRSLYPPPLAILAVCRWRHEAADL